jgi:uncharacterized protein YkwD
VKKLRPFLIAACASAAAVLTIALAAGTSEETSANAILDSEEQAFVQLINDYRAQNGQGPLLVDPSITAASRWMSYDMGEYNYFSHTDHLGQSPWTRMCNFGYCYNTYKGENIAAGFTTASSVFNAWKNSSGHNANMLSSNYKVMGIARAYTSGSTYGWYWTNDFGGYIPPSTSATPTPALTGTATSAPPPAPTNTPTPVPAPVPTATPSPTPVVPTCNLDSDCDGYLDAAEMRMGTDKNVACVATTTVMDEDPQPWPPDFDDNGVVNISDVLSFKGILGYYDARHDINGNDFIEMADVLSLKDVFSESCFQ